MTRNNDIAESVNRVLDRYFQDLDGEKPAAIYSLVMKNAEKPMLEFVLRQANGNQTIAAGCWASTATPAAQAHRIRSAVIPHPTALTISPLMKATQH